MHACMNIKTTKRLSRVMVSHINTTTYTIAAASICSLVIRTRKATIGLYNHETLKRIDEREEEGGISVAPLSGLSKESR